MRKATMLIELENEIEHLLESWFDDETEDWSDEKLNRIKEEIAMDVWRSGKLDEFLKKEIDYKIN